MQHGNEWSSFLRCRTNPFFTNANTNFKLCVAHINIFFFKIYWSGLQLRSATFYERTGFTCGTTMFWFGNENIQAKWRNRRRRILKLKAYRLRFSEIARTTDNREHIEVYRRINKWIRTSYLTETQDFFRVRIAFTKRDSSKLLKSKPDSVLVATDLINPF